MVMGILSFFNKRKKNKIQEITDWCEEIGLTIIPYEKKPNWVLIQINLNGGPEPILIAKNGNLIEISTSGFDYIESDFDYSSFFNDLLLTGNARLRIAHWSIREGDGIGKRYCLFSCIIEEHLTKVLFTTTFYETVEEYSIVIDKILPLYKEYSFNTQRNTNKDKTKFLGKVIQLIGKDNLEEAIESLKTSFNNSSMFPDLILLMSRLAELEKSNNRGIISREEFSTEKNKIRVSLMQTCIDLSKQTLN
jgi:hypothetical protein